MIIDHLVAVARKVDRQRRQHSVADAGMKDCHVSVAVNVLDVRRRTPLHVAVINQRLDAVRRLLSVRVTGDGVTSGRVLRRCKSIDRSPLVDIDAAAVSYTHLTLPTKRIV